MLAGISAEYYLRLERGRAKNPSPQIVEALAKGVAAGHQSQKVSAPTGQSDH